MPNPPSLGSAHPIIGEFAPVASETWARATFPLGAQFDGTNVTFAVFARRATRVLLEIYPLATHSDAEFDYWMAQNPNDGVWRACLSNIKEGTLYAFRCWGPNWQFSASWSRGGSSVGFQCDVDDHGNRYNPNKVLFDPYTREVSHDRESRILLREGLEERIFSTGSFPYLGKPSREHDTGHWAPKGVLLRSEPFSGRRPRLRPDHAIIYEAHLRGLTQHPSAARLGDLLCGAKGFDRVQNVPDPLRGTFAGAAYLAPYLRQLGFTTIELLPVHETQNETNPTDRPGGNYWGYMPNAYFAPDRHYAFDQSPGGPTREFKAMVEAFHAAGIEVYLDVVYNHSGEGGNFATQEENGRWTKQRDVTSFTSLGGFDAAEYYQRTVDNLLDDGATGCGNQLDFSKSICHSLVLDSLTYWIEIMGVDGFRFDLAPVLGRLPDATQRGHADIRRFFSDHPLLVKVRDLGIQHDVEMIAEAWDLWGYEVGNFPPYWGEWNGRYRDAIRHFVKGTGNALDFAVMVDGDVHHFDRADGAQRSVNFIVAHDGFTLMDLVSYSHKNNGQCQWPFGPTDGGLDDNASWHWDGNQGLRRQQLRNLWTILFFSRGIPMVVYGDEFGRTQNGNNNPWNVDSVATWNNYDMLATPRPNQVATGGGGKYHDNFGAAKHEEGRNPLFLFAGYLARLRRNSATLKQRKCGDPRVKEANDVTYVFRREDGRSALEPHHRCVWVRIVGVEAGEGDFLLCVNMHYQPVEFAVPRPHAGAQWVRIIDTAAWAEPEHNAWPVAEGRPVEKGYRVHAFSILVLEESMLA